MHDPYSTLGVLKIGKARIVLSHKDPCTDGTDDSCGYFQRARHGDADVLKKIQDEFDFNYKNNYWFYKNGGAVFTPAGTLICMYKTALWVVFKSNRKKVNAFMRKHLVDIMFLAENPTDCIGDTITNKYNYEGRELISERIALAGIIYADILRKIRPWYKHPKFHFRHWVLQIYIPKREKNRDAVASGS